MQRASDLSLLPLIIQSLSNLRKIRWHANDRAKLVIVFLDLLLVCFNELHARYAVFLQEALKIACRSGENIE